MTSPIRLFHVAVLAAALSTCGDQEEAVELLRPVRYTEVFSSGGNRVRTFSGTARASVESHLSFRVAGAVQRIPVNVGEAVGVGQLIAQLDPQDYRLQLQEAEAALTRARAEARNATANFDRVRQLYENNNASRNDLDAARTGAESASAQVQAAENRRDAARLQLSYTRLVAPAMGQIASVDAEINENVRAGQTIVVLTSASEIEVEVAMPEVLISRVREGNEVSVSFDALPERSFAARVTEVGVSAGGFATTFPVIVRLVESGDDIRPGMAAEVTFSFETTDTRDRVVVPLVAVGEDRDGRFVFVLQPIDSAVGYALRRAVTVGEFNDQGFEILEGLIDGELVITAGISRIRDSMRVRIPPLESSGS